MRQGLLLLAPSAGYSMNERYGNVYGYSCWFVSTQDALLLQLFICDVCKCTDSSMVWVGLDT